MIIHQLYNQQIWEMENKKCMDLGIIEHLHSSTLLFVWEGWDGGKIGCRHGMGLNKWMIGHD